MTSPMGVAMAPGCSIGPTAAPRLADMLAPGRATSARRPGVRRLSSVGQSVALVKRGSSVRLRQAARSALADAGGYSAGAPGQESPAPVRTLTRSPVSLHGGAPDPAFRGRRASPA